MDENYSVTVNSFLDTGGDNFPAFNTGTEKRDTGKVDLQAMVDYMAEFANPDQGDQPLPVDYRQQAVGVTFPSGAPASYEPGDSLSFDVSSWSMTGPSDVRDAELEVSLGGQSLGTFPVTTTLSPAGNANSNDTAGTASVTVTLPAGTPAGTTVLTLTGETTGTTTTVPVEVESAEPVPTTVTATAENIPYGTAGEVDVDVESANPTSGTVTVSRSDGQVLGTASVAQDGTATVTLAAGSLPVGTHQLTLAYSGDAANQPSTGTVTVQVVRATPTMTTDVDPDRLTTKSRVELEVVLTAPGQTVTGDVSVRVNGHNYVRQLRNGRVEFDLGRFNKAGDYPVYITYAGNQTSEPVTQQITLRINKR